MAGKAPCFMRCPVRTRRSLKNWGKGLFSSLAVLTTASGSGQQLLGPGAAAAAEHSERLHAPAHARSDLACMWAYTGPASTRYNLDFLIVKFSFNKIIHHRACVLQAPSRAAAQLKAPSSRAVRNSTASPPPFTPLPLPPAPCSSSSDETEWWCWKTSTRVADMKLPVHNLEGYEWWIVCYNLPLTDGVALLGGEALPDFNFFI